jgi:hypothetical protein
VKKGRSGRAVLRLYFLVANPIRLIITAMNIDIQNSSQNCCVLRKALRENSIKKSPKPKPSLKCLNPYINSRRKIIEIKIINPESKAFTINSPVIIELITKYSKLNPTKSRVGV